MIRVLVCGGRDYQDRDRVFAVLDDLKDSETTLIHGVCPTGADAFALSWALSRSVPDEGYIANWKEFGRAAGPIRNRAMINEGKPDLVVAFPGGKGTADMVDCAKRAGIPVMSYPNSSHAPANTNPNRNR